MSVIKVVNIKAITDKIIIGRHWWSILIMRCLIISYSESHSILMFAIKSFSHYWRPFSISWYIAHCNSIAKVFLSKSCFICFIKSQFVNFPIWPFLAFWFHRSTINYFVTNYTIGSIRLICFCKCHNSSKIAMDKHY